MKKFSCIVTIFVAMVFLAVSTAFASSKTITLQPGWNTFSTPKVLSALTFSNGSGAGLFFYQLTNSGWTSVQANTTNVKPLEWFVVNNTNTGSVQVGLDYATNLAPADMLFQKTLTAGWNFLGITTETTPFGSIGSGATMSVDFTRTSGGSNLINGVNSSFSTTSGEASIANPELGEAYAVFAQSNVLYAGSQDPVNTGSTLSGVINLTRDDYLNDTNLVSGSKGVTVYGAQFSSPQGNPISLSNLSVITTGTATSYTGGNTSLTLYVDGVAKSTKNLTTTGVTFDGFNSIVTTTTGVFIIIKADFSDITTSGTFGIASIAYDAIDTITSQGISPKPSVTGAVFTMVQPIGTLAATTGDTLVNKTLLLAGSSAQKIASFNVTASNGDIALSTLVFTWTNLDYISNIKIVDYNNNTIFSSISQFSSTWVMISDLDLFGGSNILMDQSRVFYVIADINSNSNIQWMSLNLVASWSKVTGIINNVATILTDMTGSNVPGASHDIATNTFKVTQMIPTSKNITTDAMEFMVTAFGQNLITLSGATFNNILSGYTGSTTLTIVRKSDNATVGTATGSTGVVSFTANNTVDAGTSATYIVKIVGAVMDGSFPGTPDWSVSLTSLTAGTLDATHYPKNTDTFPLTSVK